MAKQSNTKTYVLIVAIVALLAVAGYFSGLFSIAVPVGLARESGYATPDQALAACEQLRLTAQSKGQTCDPCGLACPSSARDGTYSYSNINGNFSVTFNPSKCSTAYQASGNLLEAKSFCHDTIRLCEKQSGSGSVIATTQVKNGQVQTIKYSYYLINCETGKYVGSSTLTSTIYQLTCNSGYIIDGSRTSSNSISNLGTCVLPLSDDPATGTPDKAASFKSVAISSPAESGKSLRITGSIDITGADGTYYVSGTLDQPPSGTFSVVSGSGFNDLCGNDPMTATLIKSVKKGDQLVFSLDITAPSVEGTTNLQSGYKVQVTTGCGGKVLATQSGTYDLVPKAIPTVTPIDVPVFAEPPADPQEIADLQTEVTGNTCAPGDQVELQGCIVAKCDNNLMNAIDPIICGNSTYPSPATTIDNGGAVSTAEVDSQTSLWQRFIDWLKKIFRVGG